MKVVTETVDLPVDNKGKTKAYNYSLEFEDGKLVNVRNIFGFSVDKKSGIWSHFITKYPNVYN